MSAVSGWKDVTSRCKEKRRTIYVPTTKDHSHRHNVHFFLPSVKKPRFLGSSRRPSDEAGIVCARDDAAAASTPATALMLAIQLFISFYNVNTMSHYHKCNQPVWPSYCWWIWTEVWHSHYVNKCKSLPSNSNTTGLIFLAKNSTTLYFCVSGQLQCWHNVISNGINNKLAYSVIW